MANRKQNPFDNVWQVLDYLANNFTLFAPVRDLVTKLNTKVDGYEELLQEKADDIAYDGNKVYLTSYGDKLGEGMILPDNGLSAYEIWLKHENQGTEEDFLHALKGERGPKGEDGKSFSILGQKDNEESLPETGKVGEGWLVQGNVYIWDINTNHWVNAGNLKGEKGDPGERGPQGSQGPRGEAGQRGEQGPAGQDGAKGENGIRGTKTYTGNALTGNSTEPLVFTNSGINDALVNDLYINVNTGNNNLGNVYICTRSGDASTALWKYECNIVGARGVQGERGPQGPAGQNGSKGDKGDPGLTDEERREFEEKIEDLINRIEGLENSNDIQIERITIKNKLSMMGTGEEHTLDYAIEPESATNKQVEMISSDSSVASITSSGVISCIKPGETQITVRSKRYTNISDSYSLTVYKDYVSVRGMELINVPTELPVGDSTTLGVVFNPSDATNKNVSYRSSNPSVLEVNAQTGFLMARSVGFAYITVTSEAAPFITVTSRSIQVVSKQVERAIAIGSPISSLRVYKSHNLELSVINKNVRSTGLFICESSDTLIATIDENGVVIACGKIGTATITIKLADEPKISTSFTLDTYLINPGVEEIVISCGTAYTVPRNEELYIPYTAPISLAGNTFFAYEYGTDDIISTGYVDNGFMILRASNLTDSRKYKLYFVVSKYVNGSGYTTIGHSNVITVTITDPVNSTNSVVPAAFKTMLVGRKYKLPYDSMIKYVKGSGSVTVNGFDIEAFGIGEASVLGYYMLNPVPKYRITFNIEGEGGISINNRVACLKVGQNMTIVCSEYVHNGTAYGYTFSSSNESVATVEKNGFIMTKGVGKTDIYVTHRNQPALRDMMTLEVVGTETPKKHINISNKIKAIRVGTAYKLESMLVPVGNNDTFTYSSSSPDVCYIDRFGTMVGVRAGYSDISVISANYKETFRIKVYDLPLGAIELYISTLTGEDMYATNGSAEFPFFKSDNSVSIDRDRAELVYEHNDQIINTNSYIIGKKIIFNGLPKEDLIGVYIVTRSRSHHDTITARTAPFNLYVKRP